MNTIPASTLIRWAQTLSDAITQSEMHRLSVSGFTQLWLDAHANHTALATMKADLMRLIVTDVAVEKETV
jgi:hypothetical protein